MSPFQQRLGVIAFWITWPGIWLLLHRTKRTRVCISCDDKVLVVKQWLGNGKWSLPGGGIKRGEAPMSAAIREVKEETGIVLNPTDLKLVMERGRGTGTLGFSYHEFAVSSRAQRALHRQPREVSAINWVDKNSLNKSNANSDVLLALRGH